MEKCSLLTSVQILSLIIDCLPPLTKSERESLLESAKKGRVHWLRGLITPSNVNEIYEVGLPFFKMVVILWHKYIL